MRTLLTLLLLASASFLSAQGIAFEHTTWADILAKAKKENKLVFLDAYTSWCGPCKMMAKQTFTDAEVAKYFNASFVNAKIDMEKGEGPDLATRYDVQAYPTLIFVDGDGAVVHRALGYHDAAQFVALGQAANDPAKSQRGLDQRYARGDRDPEFLVAYLAAKSAANDPNVGQIAADYLATQTNWGTKENMEIILNYANDPAGKPFEYFLTNKAKFTEMFGEEAVTNKGFMAIGTYIEQNPDAPMAETQALIRRIIGGAEGDKMAAYYPVMYYQNTGDVALYAAAAVAYFNQFPPDNWSELNEMAWSFYENVDDKKMLEQALEWAKKSVALEANYYNTDTLAALYYKLGNKKQALKHAKQAIELAKKSDTDYSGTEQLIEKIKAKK